MERTKQREKTRVAGGDNGSESDSGSDDERITAALQEACVSLGYDESQARRRELVKMLSGVQQGGPFADDLLGWVVDKTGASQATVIRVLKPQVATVLKATQAAVCQNEQELFQKDSALRQHLRDLGLCEAGFGWHREGAGFRCNGGICYIHESELSSCPSWNA